MYFYWKEETSQKLNMEVMIKECEFTPNYLKGIKLGANSRKFCTNIWSILRKNSPKIVIVPEFQILAIQVILYKWLFRKKFKIISMCDDSYDMLANNNDFSLIHKWARKILAPMVNDILLVDSRSVNWYKENYKKGIWLPIIRNEEKEKDLFKQAIEISKRFIIEYNLVGKKVLLFVGRLVKLKNISRLISAIEKTNEVFSTVIVGGGPELEELKCKASKTNKEILFVGHFENQEIRAWYNLASVFALVSYLEPFGAVTNEALLAGCRVVISEKAGSMCLVSKENGEIVNPMNVDEIAVAIDRQISMADVADLKCVRSSKMNVLFKERIEYLIKELKH